MQSNNWGYSGFITDIQCVFGGLLSTYGFTATPNTDTVSYIEFKNKHIGLYFLYDTSKALQLSFKKYSAKEQHEYNLAACSILKKIAFSNPICEFRDQACIKKGWAYIHSIVSAHFTEELKGIFTYKDNYTLLMEENYFLKKELAFLPMEDPIKLKIKNNFAPNTGLKEIRKRLIEKEQYPEKYIALYNAYLKQESSKS